MVLQQKSERHSMQQAEERIRKLYILHMVIKPKKAGFFSTRGGVEEEEENQERVRRGWIRAI